MGTNDSGNMKTCFSLTKAETVELCLAKGKTLAQPQRKKEKRKLEQHDPQKCESMLCLKKAHCEHPL